MHERRPCSPSSRRRRPSLRTPLGAGLATCLFAVACSDGEALDAPDGGATIGHIEQAVTVPILNSYDPNQKGTFVSNLEGLCPGWTEIEDGWQVWTGLVTAGNPTCDATNISSGCPYPPTGEAGAGPYQNHPVYSREDWPGTHDGRDLNLSFLPTDWKRIAINTNVTLPSQSVVIEVEVETQYVWPTVNWGDNEYDGHVFREGFTSGTNAAYGEPWNLPTPQPGDQLTINGLHVRDECHGDPAEIHPPQAMAWLRKVSAYDYDLTFDAASHSFRPFENSRSNLPGAYYYFRIHDYDPSLSSPVQISYFGDNWLVDPRASYTSFSGYQPARICNDSNYNPVGSTPDASFAGGDPCRAQLGSHTKVSNFFSTSTWSGFVGGYGYVGLYLASVAGTENAAGLPVLASGTYRVCQPHASNNYCAPRLPTFAQVSQGIAPKKLSVNFKNYKSGLWGDFRNNNTVSGEQFQQYSYHGGNNQRFNLNYAGTDATGPYFTIQNYNGKYFDTYPGTGNGQPVYQASYYGDAYQRWRFVPTNSEGRKFGYFIKNVASGRCIAIGGGSMSVGAGSILWDCLGQADTVWLLAEQ